MNPDLQNAVNQYLCETLGILATFSEWADADGIPYAIRGGYEFCKIRLLEANLIAVAAKGVEEFSAAKLAKHLAWIEEKHGHPGVYITKGLESYNRKRLIEQKVPFIVPGNQLYLPELGIDLREHLRNIRKKSSKLSPSAQMVLLAKLLGKFSNETWTATVLAGCFDSNKMSMSRAIDDLERHEIIETRIEGREKQVHFKMSGRELWEKAKPVLRSPVQKNVFVENVDLPLGSIAGLSALSDQSMLVEPSRPVRALAYKGWQALQKEAGLRMIPKASADMAPLELEIWKYDPRRLSKGEFVDPLSLYLSLEGNQDDRVEAALDDLLEEMEW
jgi:DNA-binding MarR family transcriptional regulator